MESATEASEGSTDWCNYKNADKWIKKYVMHDTSEPYFVEKVLGIVTFKGKSYGAADMQLWAGDMYGGEMRHCGTIYFNEDGSNIWVHFELYEAMEQNTILQMGKSLRNPFPEDTGETEEE